MRWCRLVAIAVIALQGMSAQAQQTSKGGVDPAQPLYLQADQLTYDTRGNRVIAQGSVEIYYDNYILTADQVTFDESTKKLIAEGNAQIKDPGGNVTRADRLEALDEMSDAFARSLNSIIEDQKRFGPAPSK